MLVLMLAFSIQYPEETGGFGVVVVAVIVIKVFCSLCVKTFTVYMHLFCALFYFVVCRNGPRYCHCAVCGL